MSGHLFYILSGEDHVMYSNTNSRRLELSFCRVAGTLRFVLQYFFCIGLKSQLSEVCPSGCIHVQTSLCRFGKGWGQMHVLDRGCEYEVTYFELKHSFKFTFIKMYSVLIVIFIYSAELFLMMHQMYAVVTDLSQCPPPPPAPFFLFYWTHISLQALHVYNCS